MPSMILSYASYTIETSLFSLLEQRIPELNNKNFADHISQSKFVNEMFVFWIDSVCSWDSSWEFGRHCFRWWLAVLPHLSGPRISLSPWQIIRITKIQKCWKPLITRYMGPTWDPSGAAGPRWAPCWPDELCYLGPFQPNHLFHISQCANK